VSDKSCGVGAGCPLDTEEPFGVDDPTELLLGLELLFELEDDWVLFGL
jgi:hypothetical protein